MTKKPAEPKLQPADAYPAPDNRPYGDQQRRLEYRLVFSGDVGGRVLHDLLHRICGVLANPLVVGPAENNALTNYNVGRQAAGLEVLKVLAYPARDVIKTEVERYENE